MNKRQMRATFRKYLFGFTFEVISPATDSDGASQSLQVSDDISRIDLNNEATYTDVRELAGDRSQSPY